MKRKVDVSNFYKLFAIICLILVLVLSGVVIHKCTLTNALTNGIKTTAKIIQGSYDSNTTTNGVDYYHISFSYEDEEGNIQVGQTSDSFTLTEIMELERDGFIEIYYNPNTKQAIEASYNFLNDSLVMILCLALFTLADIALWVSYIKSVIRKKKEKQALATGKEYTATFISYKTNIQANEENLYNITYSWTDETGKTYEQTSESCYTLNDALTFEQAQTFKIKANNDSSVIISDPSTLISSIKTDLNQTSKAQVSITCPYCNSRYSSDKEKCPNCGSSKST